MTTRRVVSADSCAIGAIPASGICVRTPQRSGARLIIWRDIVGRTRTLTADAAFNQFWVAYPKHVAKVDALKAWHQVRPSPDDVKQMVTALGWQSQTPAWTKDRGAFVPYPASWLRGRRWEDEAPRDAPVKAGGWACPHDPPCMDGATKCDLRTRLGRVKL